MTMIGPSIPYWHKLHTTASDRARSADIIGIFTPGHTGPLIHLSSKEWLFVWVGPPRTPSIAARASLSADITAFILTISILVLPITLPLIYIDMRTRLRTSAPAATHATLAEKRGRPPTIEPSWRPHRGRRTFGTTK